MTSCGFVIAARAVASTLGDETLHYTSLTNATPPKNSYSTPNCISIRATNCGLTVRLHLHPWSLLRIFIATLRVYITASRFGPSASHFPQRNLMCSEFMRPRLQSGLFLKCCHVIFTEQMWSFF